MTDNTKLTRLVQMKHLENFFILAAHLGLLYWILQVLENSGVWSFNKVALHFTGLAIAGSCLIIGSAKIIKRRFLLENSQ